MKQNERLLVYAVTGFLAVILVIAVWFGNDTSASLRQGEGTERAAQGVRGLGDLLNDPSTPATAQDGVTIAPKTDEVAATDGGPLVAKGTTMVAAELVAQQLGASRKERMVRWVVARAGDSLETLVVRWCGSRDFVEAAMRLNEDLRTLQVGREVAVPWVDDEVVLQAHESRQAKKLSSMPLAQGQPQGAVPASATTSRIDSLFAPRVPEAGPTQVQPSVREPSSGDAPSAGEVASAAGLKRYVVKSGDSLWRIAAREYGKGEADRMVKEIQQANPGLSTALKPDQVLLLPSR